MFFPNKFNVPMSIVSPVSKVFNVSAIQIFNKFPYN